MAGLILTKVPPQYPVEARNAGVSGTVVMHAMIGKDGTIKNLTVISGPALLQTAAVDAVKQWTPPGLDLHNLPIAHVQDAICVALGLWAAM